MSEASRGCHAPAANGAVVSGAVGSERGGGVGLQALQGTATQSLHCCRSISLVRVGACAHRNKPPEAVVRKMVRAFDDPSGYGFFDAGQ